MARSHVSIQLCHVVPCPHLSLCFIYPSLSLSLSLPVSLSVYLSNLSICLSIYLSSLSLVCPVDLLPFSLPTFLFVSLSLIFFICYFSFPLLFLSFHIRLLISIYFNPLFDLFYVLCWFFSATCGLTLLLGHHNGCLAQPGVPCFFFSLYYPYVSSHQEPAPQPWRKYIQLFPTHPSVQLYECVVRIGSGCRWNVFTSTGGKHCL